MGGVTGILLAWWYDPAWPGSVDALGPDQRMSRAFARLHVGSLIASVVTVALALAVLLVNRRPRAEIAGAGVATIAALVAWLTWPLVAWDNVALTAVTVGSGMRGLWWPAFDDGIAFLLIGGAEIAQGTYRRWLLVHLAAPFVGLVALGIAIRPRRSRPSPEQRAPAPADAAEVPPVDMFPDNR